MALYPHSLRSEDYDRILGLCSLPDHSVASTPRFRLLQIQKLRHFIGYYSSVKDSQDRTLVNLPLTL